MTPFTDRLKKIPDTVWVFLVFFIFFILNLTSNFSGPHDSMGYLNDLDKARDLFPAHHLIYHYTAFQLLHLLSFIFPHVQHYYLVETIDAAWGCLGLTMVYRIFLRRMKMTRLQSFLSTAVAAFSYGMWFYCSNIEVYMPSVFFLLCGLYICMKSQLEKSDLILLILAHSLAVLFHQSNVLFAGVVIWKLWDSRKTLPFLPSFFRYAILSSLLVGAVYFGLGWFADGHNTLPDFYTWLRGYTLESGYWFPLSFGTLFKALVGCGHAFFGGHYIFRVRFLQAFMTRIFYYHSLDDEAYLVRNLNYTVALILLILTIAVALLLFVLFVRILINWKKLYPVQKKNMVPPLLFLVIYSAFFFFWMPENLEFWIPQSVVFWIFLLGMNCHIGFSSYLLRNNRALVFLAAMMFIINYTGSIYWMKDIRNDSVYVKVSKVKELAKDKDIILLQDSWLLEDFLEHYTPSTISRVPTEPAAIAKLNARITGSLQTGGKIYVFTEANSVHSSTNKIYVDSLLSANASKTTDLNNPLTTVKMITPP